MKALTYVFGAATVGIVFCFAMAIVTAVQDHHAEQAARAKPLAIPLPAQ